VAYAGENPIEVRLEIREKLEMYPGPEAKTLFEDLLPRHRAGSERLLLRRENPEA